MCMNFVVLTIFPVMFDPFWAHGIVRKAIENEKITASAVNIRDYTEDRHQMTDDRPYGGGSGMVMKPEPLARAIRAATKRRPGARTVLLTPQGQVFSQKLAHELASVDSLVLVCGRYEGVDERICHDLIDYEVSIGDYVLTGGELAGMVIIDAVTRLIPGTLGGENAAEKDSFADGLLEHAHYTRPRIFEGKEVPEILLSGHHGEIENWRLKSSLIRTFLKRPDLLREKILNRREIGILEDLQRNIEKILKSQSQLDGQKREDG
jgi:tRNA (guanine37-N1)-methyltransferase